MVSRLPVSLTLCIISLLVLGCSRTDEGPPIPLVDPIHTSDSPVERKVIIHVAPHPEVVGMDWHYVLLYTLQNQLSSEGHTNNIRVGLQKRSARTKLMEIAPVIQGHWGPYSSLLWEHLQDTAPTWLEPNSQKEREWLDLVYALFPQDARTLDEYQLAWAQYLNRGWYDHLLYLSTQAKADTLTGKWLKEASQLDLTATFIAQGTVASVSATWNQDLTYEGSLRSQPISSQNDLLVAIRDNKQPARWQNLRLLHYLLTQYYMTNSSPHLALIPFSSDSSDTLLAKRTSLIQILQQ
jgi:hypothetical protein